MLLMDFGSSFRDEMIATAIVLAVTIGGSFFLLDRYSHLEDDSGGSAQVLGAESQEDQKEPVKELNIENKTQGVATPTPATESTPTPLPTPEPSPTLEPAIVEVPYGASQTFDNDYYILKFSKPILLVGVSKKYEVEVVLANKTVENDGLSNALLATITRDGEVVADDVPMTLSEAKRVKKGEKITYTASLSMIEGTDITKVVYKPTGGVVPSTYLVKP